MAQFACLTCHQPLQLTGTLPHDGASFVNTPRSTTLGPGQPTSASRLDDSFVLLPDAARRRAGAPTSTSTGTDMAESFVVLPQSGGGAGLPGDALSTLSRVFELASDATKIDQPMCIECAQQLREELDAQIKEAESEIDAYTNCLAQMQIEEKDEALSETQFAAEMAKMAEDEKQIMQQLQEVEARRTKVDADVAHVESEEAAQRALRAKYWHEFNEFNFQLQAHMEERDAVLARIESTCEARERLRHTNVYNDAFHIWHHGPFGTINNFRLGRLPNAPVEWDEINAAWGQTCLLLHSMAQACKFNFSSYRILPLGNHPRIADNKNIYELYGPVNSFWSAKYDKAMICFLACLQEFADFAKARDIAYNHSPPFELPYKVEQDKIDGKTIKYSFNRDDKWTAALKLMLSNLKVALAWLTANKDRTGT